MSDDNYEEDLTDDISDKDENSFDDINEINLTPDRLLYSCIARIQKAMEIPNITTSIEMVLMLTNELELLLVGCNKITDEYRKKIKEYIDSEDYKSARTDLIKNSKMGNFKRALLYVLVFEPSSINAPLTLKPPMKRLP